MMGKKIEGPEAEAKKNLKNMLARAAKIGDSRGRGESAPEPVAQALMEIAPELLLAGKLDAPIFGSDTALTLACARVDPEAVEFVLGLGANPKTTTQYGQSAIMQVLHGLRDDSSPEAWEKGKACMQMALDAGCDLAHRNQIGQQAINWASWRGKDLAPAIWLLARGANPSAACSDGRTPLHDCARQGQVEMARLFVEAGADLFKKATQDGKKLDPVELCLEWMGLHSGYDVLALLAEAQAVALESKALQKSVPRKKAKPKPRPGL